MSKKKKINRKIKINKRIIEIDIIKAIRRLWFINPATKVIPSKKNYTRKKYKKEIENE